MVVRVSEVREVGWVTGGRSANRTAETAAILATDLGICWDDGAGGVLVAFGDSYGAGWGGHGAGPEQADWRCNALARSTRLDPALGLVLDAWVSDAPGHAAAILPRERGEHTVIPTAGIAVAGRQYLAYMSVTAWDGPGAWRTRHAGIATSEDLGGTWVRGRDARWRNSRRHDQPFQQVAFAPDGEGRVLLFGTPNGRFGDVRLARAADRQLAEPAAWEYWDGSGWASGLAGVADAAVVARGPAGELSVAWHAGLRCWLMLHLDEHRAAVVARSAPEPVGPWSAGVEVVSGRRYPGLYGGYLHPWSLDGDAVAFTLSQWEPYNVALFRAVLAVQE